MQMPLTTVHFCLIAIASGALLMTSLPANASGQSLLSESFGDDIVHSCDAEWAASCEADWVATGETASLSMCRRGAGPSLDWGIGLYGVDLGSTGVGQQVVSPRDAASGLPTSVGVSVRAAGVLGTGHITTKLVFDDDQGVQLGSEELSQEFTAGDALTTFLLVTPPAGTATVDVRVFSEGAGSFLFVSDADLNQYAVDSPPLSACYANAELAEQNLNASCPHEDPAFTCTGTRGSTGVCEYSCSGVCLSDAGADPFDSLVCDN